MAIINESAITYLNSVDNFPTTKRNSVNKLLTENSLTRLINRLIDKDGFIITEGLRSPSFQSGDRGNLLDFNTNIKLRDVDFENNILEFMLRGYYFSVNLSDLLSSDKGVNWEHYVTTYGQDTTPFGLYARIFIDATDPNYPELLGQEAYDEELETYKGVQFFVCSIDNKPSPSHPSIPTDAQTTLPIGLGSDYFYYDLLLLEYINNDSSVSKDTYIPFSSLNKFNTHTVEKIDGGEIILYK